MAYYRSKHYGIEASVDALNRESADKQLEWLLEQKPCFCLECRELYSQQYSINILEGYEPTSTCTKTATSMSNTRFI